MGKLNPQSLSFNSGGTHILYSEIMCQYIIPFPVVYSALAPQNVAEGKHPVIMVRLCSQFDPSVK